MKHDISFNITILIHLLSKFQTDNTEGHLLYRQHSGCNYIVGISKMCYAQ